MHLRVNLKFLGAILVHPVRRQNFAGTGAPQILQHLRLCRIDFLTHECNQSNGSIDGFFQAKKEGECNLDDGPMDVPSLQITLSMPGCQLHATIT